MRDREWSRTEQAQRVREQIWQYLSPAAVRSESVLPVASALLRLPSQDVRLLRSLHLLLAPETAELAEAGPALLRHLRTSTTASLEQHPDRVRGPIDWPATLTASAAQARRYAFATRPPERDYATPENRLLRGALQVVADAATSLPWDGSRAGISQTVAARGDLAATLLGSPTLRRVVPAVEARDAHRVEHGRAARRFAPVVRFWRLHERLEVLQDPGLLREMVEGTALLASTDGALLEVLVLIDVLEALRAEGWVRSHFGLIQGRAVIRHLRGTDTLDVHYQATPVGLASRYERVLRHHGLPASALRPDLALDRRLPSGHRIVSIVEIKYRRRAADAVRAALFDLLAYRDTYGDAEPEIRLAGVGWGRGLAPSKGADVLLCTPDRVAELVALLVD